MLGTFSRRESLCIHHKRILSTLRKDKACVYSPQAHVWNISARKTCVFTTRAFFETVVRATQEHVKQLTRSKTCVVSTRTALNTILCSKHNVVLFLVPSGSKYCPVAQQSQASPTSRLLCDRSSIHGLSKQHLQNQPQSSSVPQSDWHTQRTPQETDPRNVQGVAHKRWCPRFVSRPGPAKLPRTLKQQTSSNQPHSCSVPQVDRPCTFRYGRIVVRMPVVLHCRTHRNRDVTARRTQGTYISRDCESNCAFPLNLSSTSARNCVVVHVNNFKQQRWRPCRIQNIGTQSDPCIKLRCSMPRCPAMQRSGLTSRLRRTPDSSFISRVLRTR